MKPKGGGKTTEDEIEVVAMEYINDRDDFDIEYDEETGTKIVSY